MKLQSQEETQSGQLTKKGQRDMRLLGQTRRQELIESKQVLSEYYDPLQVLIISTDFQRTYDSLLHFFYGLYPLQSETFFQEQDYKRYSNVPIAGTEYDKIVQDNLRHQCISSSILRIPSQYDTIMSTQSCPKIFEYLSTDKFDMKTVKDNMNKDIGHIYKSTMQEIEKKLGTKVETLRDYFDKSDQIIFEYSYLESDNKTNFQLVQTYILAKNFVSKDSDLNPGIFYRSRLLNPLLEVLLSAKNQLQENQQIQVKYIVHGLHDLNIAQILEFFGYFDSYG